jgi:hypothetical protein
MVYSINGGKNVEYIGAIKGLPKGKNELKVIAYDKLGNTSELNLSFSIE